MELIKEKWTRNDFIEFDEYLESLAQKEKIPFTKNIVRTEMCVLSIPIPVLRKIAKEICKGGYISFLDNIVFSYYESTIVFGEVLCHIKDFDVLKKYLYVLCDVADNWSTCDTLKFKIDSKNAQQFYNLSLVLVKDERTFARRIGLIILFKLVNQEEYLDKIFDIITSLKDEPEYYVNMAVAWLLQVCFVKNRDKTFEYLWKKQTNEFVLRKTVSKCRDSFRVSAEDKNLLLELLK